MKMKFFAAALFLYSCIQAQTKELAFKSHSGNRMHYHAAEKIGFFGDDHSDFGLPESRIIITLDSVIYLSPEKTIEVVRTETEISGGNLKPIISWRRDTIVNSQTSLYSNRHALDSIKKAIQQSDRSNQLTGKTIFLGFDNKKSKRHKARVVPQKQQVTPLVSLIPPDSPNSPSPVNRDMLYMLLAIFGLAAISGFATWIFGKKATQSKNLVIQ